MQKGIAHLLLILVIAVVAILGFLVATGKIKLPGNLSFEKKPTVAVKTEYENPFKKETQFVNPFQTYKNPFVVNR